jgi:hypothetical protein
VANGYFGGFGAPGTRITKRQDEKSELWIYVKQAVMGAAAIDVMVFFILLLLLSVGWPSLALLAFGLVWIVRLVAKHAIQDVLARKRLVRAIVISICISFLVFAPYWWDWLIGRGEMLKVIGMAIAPLFLPYWVYAGLLVFWFLAALKKHGKLTAAFICAMLLLYAVYAAGFGDVDFAPIAKRIRFVSPLFLLSPILFSGVLGVVMLKEMLLPNFDITLSAIPYKEYVEAGGIFGVLAPKIKNLWPTKLERIRLEMVSNGGHTEKYTDWPYDERSRMFYQAVDAGESFTYRTAGMGRNRFNKLLRDPFLENDLAVWIDEQHPQQGIELTDYGKQVVHSLATGTPLPEYEYNENF